MWQGQLCEKCFEWGSCWDGICVDCQPLVRSGDIAFRPARLVKQCVACGSDHDRHGELCSSCQEQTAREFDDVFVDRKTVWRRSGW